MPKFLVVVPARGGSKRVPGKNIRPLGGRPLLAHTLACAVSADLGCPIIVSTEDPAIADVARSCGVAVIDRPAALATDTASTEDVLLHVLDAMSPARPEWVITLPPTAPFRRASTLRRFTDAIAGAPELQDCLMSVTEDRGDFWTLSADGSLGRLFPNAPRRQQDRAPLYLENSAIYVTRVAALEATRSVLGNRVRGIAIDRLEGFDINDELDFAIAEALLAAGVTHAP